MKKTLLSFFFAVLMASTAMAAPAKRGQWQTMRSADGAEVLVQLCGDENFHYYESADGKLFKLQADGVTLETITAESVSTSMAKARKARHTQTPRKGKRMPQYTGVKKGIVVLVQYTDVKFQDGHDREFFNRMANEEGFTSDEGFVGSVKDYFKNQSFGQFELDFDIYGPIDLAHEMSYYGGNNMYGNDKNPEKMVSEAVEALKDSVDFSVYDWDGDGEVEQIYIIYAGQGEANGGSSSTVWPHEWQMQYATGSRLEVNGTYIDTYGCSCELNGQKKIDGIGTFCHEFSHCLGFPDLYDTYYVAFGMNKWSILDYGCYNGNGYIPSGYTSYERMTAGWISPVELTADTVITDMGAINETGEAYIMYNDGNPNEYYLLENRQKTGWDIDQDGEGLLILHVDYDEDSWTTNSVNTESSHQRCSIFHADNRAGSSSSDLAGDPYPYYDNDSLCKTSSPKASLFNSNSKGKKYMELAIKNITLTDGKISFNTEVKNTAVVPDGDVMMYESFNECDGHGGNNGVFNTGANSTFAPDLDGWEYVSAYGGQQCARFGKSSNIGECTTPSFTLEGQGTLTFRAAPWNTDGTQLVVTVNDVPADTLDMVTGEWTDFSLDIECDGATKVKFTPSKRFFLDEVKVVKKSTDGIIAVAASSDNKAVNKALRSGYYSISGQFAGDNKSTLKPGLYIKNGRKIVVK